MIGNKYEFFGTDNTIEILYDHHPYWGVDLRPDGGQAHKIFILKQDLNESVNQGSLVKI